MYESMLDDAKLDVEDDGGEKKEKKRCEAWAEGGVLIQL